MLNDAACTLVQPGHPIIGEVARSRCSKTSFPADQYAVGLAARGASAVAAQRPALTSGGRIQLARFMAGGNGPTDPGAIADAAASAVTMSNLALEKSWRDTHWITVPGYERRPCWPTR